MPARCELVLAYRRGAVAPDDGDAGRLDDLGRWLGGARAVEVTIRAHADGTGTTQHNFELSEKRGEWILQRLKRAGVAPGRVTAQAFGEYVPLDGLGRDDDRNRRTVVHLRGAATCPIEEASP
ncbi:MAG: OmpA family protein [bacterium]